MEGLDFAEGTWPEEELDNDLYFEHSNERNSMYIDSLYKMIRNGRVIGGRRIA